MFSRRRRPELGDTHEAGDTPDTGTSNAKRSDRGWGPFTGGQLTAIILGLTLATAFPIGAWAVSGTTVFVTDKATGQTAAVSPTGQLSVNATGSVTATPTPPSESYNTRWVYVFDSDPCDSLTPKVPAGKALIVLSVTVNISGTSAPGPVIVAVEPAKPGTPCVPVVDAVDISGVSGQGASETIPFPQGLPIKSGHVLGMHVGSLTGTVVATAEVKGYLVSSSLCTVNAPPTGCW